MCLIQLQQVRIFAGVKRNRYGVLEPTGVGRLCNWTPDQNGPPADEYTSFGAYQRSLRLKCDSGVPGAIQWTPDRDTPDTVFYHCFTHRYLGWKINVLDSCDRDGQSSDIDEVFVQPDAPESLQPAQSIRHETKIKPNDIFLLQNERKIDQQLSENLNNNNLENRNDKSHFELTKMIANGILAAEALESSLKNRTSSSSDEATLKPLPSKNGDPRINTPVEPLPMYLTPPKSKVSRPFRFEGRIPIPREKNNTVQYILPMKPQSRYKSYNYNSHPPPPPSNFRIRYQDEKPIPPIFLNDRSETFRKGINNERQRYTKISMPPSALRRDYATSVKTGPPQFPQQNKPLSLQKHLLHGPPPPSAFASKQKFSAPIKISKKDLMIPSAANVGFQPDRIVVESGFRPISRRRDPHEVDEVEEEEIERRTEQHDAPEYEDDYPDQKQRRSDKSSGTEDESTESEQTELLIKTFEPMFIPSPLDSTNISSAKTQTKRLTGDLQYMEMEEGEDKMAMAGEKHAYYLPPDNKAVKTTKLHPAGTIVAYDGRAVLDKALFESEPDFETTPKRSGSIMSGISSTEQLLHLPQFGPFRGEIPPLPRSQQRSKAS